MLNLQPISVTGSTFTVTKDLAETVIKLNRAAGSTLTLPSAIGSGRSFTIFVETSASGGSYVVQVTTTDTMAGVAILGQDSADTAVLFETASDSDTITMNGTTKGGLLGDQINLVDVSSGRWMVRMIGSATGTEASPFSAAVS